MLPAFLQSVAKKVTILNNDVTLHILPYRPAKIGLLRAELGDEIEAQADDDMRHYVNLFYIMEGYFVGLECKNLDNPYVAVMRAWWQMVQEVKDAKTRFDYFVQLIPVDSALFAEIVNAWESVQYKQSDDDAKSNPVAKGRPVQEPDESDEDFLAVTADTGTA